ncbi:MAG TPA: DNA repair protein RecN [Candidatus Hydrogenedentes bacterium]|nr:DNA repair protein RecN [Candidatus Hydrogenedentota bacterium]
MLELLRVQNLALIDNLEIEFKPGFNVITGETGAGKSIVVHALGLALGARASSEVIRAGADSARVEAVFRISRVSSALRNLLAEQDISLEEDTLYISRTVSADGRSRVRAGDRMIPVSVLAAIGEELVDLHGQHEHQSLLKPARQRQLLDHYAGTADLAEEVRQKTDELKRLEAALAALRQEDRDRQRRVDLLRHEYEEIQRAGLYPAEEETLRAALNRAVHAERLFSLSGQAYGALYGAEEGVSALDRVDEALRLIGELAAIDEGFKALGRQLEDARAIVESVADELRRHADRDAFDPEDLDALQRRMALINDLKRKYGPTVQDVLSYGEKAADEIRHFETRDQQMAELQQRMERCLAEASRAAGDLSRKRKQASAKLARQVMAEMHQLGMKGAKFEVGFEDIPLCSYGTDEIAFMLAANAGEPLKPLRQVASGGEISRVMLALKTVFADSDGVETLVFDEIDAGVGGATARAVGRKMADLGKYRQVLCVTHLPQIASRAGSHYVVRKESDGGRVVTRLQEINGSAREEEIARMLAGVVNETSLVHARELLVSGE